ncbi:MAG: glycosyl hydrolase 108 family protein [Pseudomonadota bacterium]
MTLIKPNLEEFLPNIGFEIAIKYVLLNEGGFANDAADPGGITNYGITLRFLREYSIDLNGDGVIDERDIIEMTIPQAKWVYRRFIWELNHYGKFDHPTIATKAFDMAVNMGESQATKLLQRAINTLSQPDIVVDGVRGPKTLEKANGINPFDLLREMRLQCKSFYELLVQKRPKLKRFLNTWLRRAKQ